MEGTLSYMCIKNYATKCIVNLWLNGEALNNMDEAIAGLLFLIAYLSQPILLQLPPCWWRKYVSLTWLFLLAHNHIWHYENQKVELARLGSGLMLLWYAHCINIFIFIEYPEHRDFRVAKGEKLSQVESYKCWSKEKINWAFYRTIFNIRGIGWNYQIPKDIQIIKTKEEQKWSYILVWCAKKFVMSIMVPAIIYNFLCFTILTTDYMNFREPGWNPDAIGLCSESNLSISQKLFVFYSIAYLQFFGISLIYSCLCITTVLSRIYDPSDCSEIFGSFIKITESGWTVGKLWSEFWHQLLYFCLVPMAKYTLSFFRFSSHNVKRVCFILVVFTLSAVLHAHATSRFTWNYGEGYNINIPAWVPDDLRILDTVIISPKYWMNSFLFFFCQGVFIVLELFIIRFYKFCVKRGYIFKLPRLFQIILGFCWVSLIEFYLLGNYFDEMVKAGLRIEILEGDYITPWIFQKVQNFVTLPGQT